MTFTVDSHCHLDMPDFDADREEVVERARAAGVATMLVVGGVDDEDGQQRALRVAAAFGLPVSVGLHPHQAGLAAEAMWERIRGLAREGRVVATGEVGLDYHYDHSPRPAQCHAFRCQVRLARELGVPLIVHSREADEDTAEILESEGAGEVGGVIHCFTGGPDLARRALALGFHISFSGIVAFPRAEAIRKVAGEVPLDRLLVETDAPYLAPPPHRGRRNEPAFVTAVVREVAKLRGMDEQALGRTAAENFARLFGVSTSKPIRG